MILLHIDCVSDGIVFLQFRRQRNGAQPENVDGSACSFSVKTARCTGGLFVMPKQHDRGRSIIGRQGVIRHETVDGFHRKALGCAAAKRWIDPDLPKLTCATATDCKRFRR